MIKSILDIRRETLNQILSHVYQVWRNGTEGVPMMIGEVKYHKSYFIGAGL